jgi:hypothetical protein
MTQHLSREQISDLLVSRDGGKYSEHLDTCEMCGAEAAKLRGAISSFAAAAREWSRKQDLAEAPLMLRKISNSRKRMTRLAWAMAIAAVLLLIFSSSIYVRHESQRDEAATLESDDALMQQIDTEVSRRAPAAMDPLVRASSASGNDSTGQAATSGSNTQGQGGTK